MSQASGGTVMLNSSLVSGKLVAHAAFIHFFENLYTPATVNVGFTTVTFLELKTKQL